MARWIKGMAVVLVDKVLKGEDPFGAPIYEDKEIVVDNVLVVPSDSQETLNQLSISGHKAVYILGIPKGDNHEWADKEVRFFGKKWRVFGTPLKGMEHLIPLDWNKKVAVEVYG